MFDFAPGADFEAERASDEDVAAVERGGVPGKGSRIAAIFGLVQRRAVDSGAARGVMSEGATVGGATAGGATAGGATVGGATAGGALAGGAMAAGGATAGGATVGGATAGGALAGGASVGRGEDAGPTDDPFGLHLAAAHGVHGAATALPYRAELERAMGVDLGGISAHVGGAAADACAALDARAYATGDQIAFASAPDLHTAAHEVTHVLQQRAGLQLPGGIGAAGDAHEQAADAIADAVVRGESVIGRLPTGRGSGAAVVQRAGMGDVRRVDGGQHLEATEAEFLAQLHPSFVRVGPHPLRMEPGRPYEVAVRVFSPAAPPRGAKPIPVVCDLVSSDGETLAIADGTWRAAHHRSPVLRVTVQEPARYQAVVRVNAGRPGERILKTSFRVTRATEETVAHDQGARLAKGHGKVAVTTYRDLLAAVSAARTLTDAGDPKSYARALALLDPVRDRLWEIYPRVVEAREQFGFARNVMDLHFDAARAGIDGWVTRLHMGGTIATKEPVTRFEAAETEIKLGIGEQADTGDLRAADRAAWRTTKVVGVATAVVVLLPVAVEVGASVGARVTASAVSRWAAAHPYLALAVAEIVLTNGIAIGEAGGFDNYLDGLKQNIPQTAVQIFLDFVAVWVGHGADQPPKAPSGNRGGRPRELPAGEAPPAGNRKALPLAAGEEPEPSSTPGARRGAADEEGEETPAPRADRGPAANLDEAPSPVVAKGMRASGMTAKAVEAVMQIAKKFGVRISFRPTNPEAAAQLARGAEPKPESIKANTVNKVDLQLGMPKDKLGLVAHWNGWRLPRNIDAIEAADPARAKRIRDRYAERMESYDKYAADMDKLVKKGDIEIEGGIVHNKKTGNAYTGDYDLYEITKLNGKPVPEGSWLYRRIAKLLRLPPVRIQHGPLKNWLTKSLEEAALKQKLIDRHEKAQDIVNIGPDDIDVGTRISR